MIVRHNKDPIGQLVARAALGRWFLQPSSPSSPRWQPYRCRTSSTELVLKLRSMAPATLPAARNGPLGQKLSVAERSALLSIAIAPV